jgi:5-methylcytosine-specific restriction endonuclease McrA
MDDWQQIGDVAQNVVERLFRCAHPNQRIVWTRFSNYGDEYQKPQLRNFCNDCGRLIGGALKHALATDDTPTLSPEEATRHGRMWNEHYRQLEIERENQTKEWRANYDAYLKTEVWARKRKLVLERAGCLCEGCREAEASQVHHLTYKNCGNEFLWELVAICRDCHGRFHGIETANE